jgi:hypothetical protein
MDKMRSAFKNHVFFRAKKCSETPLLTHGRERSRDDLKRLDYCVAVTNACAMLSLSSNRLMVLREQPEAMPA